MIMLEGSLVLLLAVIFAAAVLQGVTSFAFGLVLMVFLPTIFDYGSAITLVSALSFILVGGAFMLNFKDVAWRVISWPLVCGYALAGGCAIYFLKQNLDLLWSHYLGGFFILLGIYLGFFQKNFTIQPTKLSAGLVGLLSGALGGLFGVPGPPMIVYFLAIKELSKKEYFATMQALGFMFVVVDLFFRSANGMVNQELLRYALLGAPVMFAGLYLGQALYKRLDMRLVQKLIYVMIILSGACLLR